MWSKFQFKHTNGINQKIQAFCLGSDLDDDEYNEDDGDDDHDDNPDHQEARGPGGGGVHLLSWSLGLFLSL